MQQLLKMEIKESTSIIETKEKRETIQSIKTETVNYVDNCHSKGTFKTIIDFQWHLGQ